MAATPPGGSGDRRDSSNRRKTVSGVLRLRDHEEHDRSNTTEVMRFPWSPPSAPTSPTASSSTAPTGKHTGHKRTFSGSILQRFNFLRGSSDDGYQPSKDKEPPKSPKSFKSRKSIDDDPPTHSPTSPKGESAIGFALKPVKARKRKGSLRKTALLGGKRILATEGRERKNSLSAKSPLGKLPLQQQTVEQQSNSMVSFPSEMKSKSDVAVLADPSSDDASPHQELRRQFSYEKVEDTNSDRVGWSDPPAVTVARLSLVTEHKTQLQKSHTHAPTPVNDLGSPLDMKSPASQASYASTTDDDDILTFDRPAKTNNHQEPSISGSNNIALQKPLSSASMSYFPTPSSSVSLIQRRASSKHQRSPLSHTISSSSLYSPTTPYPPPHDYTETEYWGWIILFATWVTFTVGMGSCLEIWSWAWDVGETPYAPPELEDDPTLPIVGYYPALIVLTGVVAWVWITVAWIGMKYFRHAKIEV